MRYTGKIQDTTAIDEAETCCNASKAVVTPTELTLEWQEDDVHFFATARSQDGGITYNGEFGTPAPEWQIKFKRFDARDGSLMLMARWWDENGDACSLMCLLSPEDEAASDTRRGTDDEERP